MSMRGSEAAAAAGDDDPPGPVPPRRKRKIAQTIEVEEKEEEEPLPSSKQPSRKKQKKASKTDGSKPTPHYVFRLKVLELALERQRKRRAGEAVPFFRPAEELKVARATPEEAVLELDKLITAQKRIIQAANNQKQQQQQQQAPAAAAAAANLPLPPGEAPTRKERSTPKTMEAQLRVDERLDICSLYSRCVKCGQAHTCNGGHRTCKVSNALRAVEREEKEREEKERESLPVQPDQERKEEEKEAEPAGPGFRIVDDKETHVTKQTLSHSLSRAGRDGPERAAFVLERFQHYAIETHYLRFFAGPAAHGYIVHTLQPVRMSVIDQFMPNPVSYKYPDGDAGEVGRRLMLDNQRFKIALIACSKEHDENTAKEKLKCTSDPLYIYCQKTFIGDDEYSDGLRQKLGSIHYISGTTLQAAASSWEINHEQMMAKAIWQRTKYFTRCCLNRVTSTIPVFATHTCMAVSLHHVRGSHRHVFSRDRRAAAGALLEVRAELDP
jgi:hypothetical protein